MRALIAYLLLTVPASAAWEVTSYKDKMTDRQETFATVKAGDASLYVGCKNGAVFPEISFPRRVAYLETGASYRFDDGAVVPRMVPVSPDGREVWLWIDSPGGALTKIRSSKRLRVQIGRDVLDFDTAGGADALAKVRCK